MHRLERERQRQRDTTVVTERSSQQAMLEPRYTGDLKQLDDLQEQAGIYIWI